MKKDSVPKFKDLGTKIIMFFFWLSFLLMWSSQCISIWYLHLVPIRKKPIRIYLRSLILAYDILMSIWTGAGPLRNPSASVQKKLDWKSQLSSPLPRLLMVHCYFFLFAPYPPPPWLMVTSVKLGRRGDDPPNFTFGFDNKFFLFPFSSSQCPPVPPTLGFWGQFFSKLKNGTFCNQMWSWEDERTRKRKNLLKFVDRPKREVGRIKLGGSSSHLPVFPTSRSLLVCGIW